MYEKKQRTTQKILHIISYNDKINRSIWSGVYKFERSKTGLLATKYLIDSLNANLLQIYTRTMCWLLGQLQCLINRIIPAIQCRDMMAREEKKTFLIIKNNNKTRLQEYVKHVSQQQHVGIFLYAFEVWIKVAALTGFYSFRLRNTFIRTGLEIS